MRLLQDKGVDDCQKVYSVDDLDHLLKQDREKRYLIFHLFAGHQAQVKEGKVLLTNEYD